MKIGLTYNLKPPDAVGDRFEEFDSIETIEALEGALRAAGHQPVRLGWGAELVAGLRSTRVDGVFNIAEGMGGRGRESQVPALLEMLGIPCTGSPPLVIAMTLDKALGKRLAQASGIPTAPFAIDAAPSDRYPLFTKPAGEGSSMGITSSSLCRNEEELHASIERLKQYGPVLVEEYLPGDEYTVGLIDGEPIGVMQVVPREREENFIYSLEVKRDYLRRVEYRLVDAPDAVRVALDVWRAFGLRDVARVDVRRDRDGAANFVEVNPLPGVHAVNSDLIILARLAGWTYEQVIGRVMVAFDRRQQRTPHPPFGHLLPSPRGEGHMALSPRGGERVAEGRVRGFPPACLAVTYNDDLSLKPHLNEFERIGEAEVAEAAREIAELLGAELVPVGADLLGALDRLRAFDLVVNLCEGVLGNPAWEMHFALALEMLGIPFTGCDPTATAICTDKTLVKKLLGSAGIATPRTGDGARFPLIVKPALGDAGIGIEPASVVHTPEERDARVQWVRETYRQPAVVEEFIEGKELNQSFFLGRALPPGEVVFADDLAPAERIVGWKAKWDAGSREDLGTANRTPAEIDDATRDALARLCSRAADVLGLHGGYCRFDVRQSRDGELYIVDINPHPDLGRDAGFRKALAAAGIGFRDFLDALIMSATHENPTRRAQGS